MKRKKRDPVIRPGKLGIMIDELVREEYGGYLNAHAHLDRADTLSAEYLKNSGTTPLALSDAALPVKQDAVGEFHSRKAYQEDLKERMERQLVRMIEDGVREVVSFIDVSPDVGLGPMQTAARLRERYKNDITLRLATQPIFGFKEDTRFTKSRMEIFEEGCKIADIVGGLPEKDDRPDSIGFAGHVKFINRCARLFPKPLHIHVDQDNLPSQQHTLDIVRALPYMDLPESEHGEPMVWFVHGTSPSSYPNTEETGRSRELLLGMRACNVGLTCCPSATLSTFQNRAVIAPQHSCVARVLEMAYLGTPIRLGTDNISDFLVPSSPGNMLYETLLLATVLRFYNPVVLAKFVAGMELNNFDKDAIREHLIKNVKRYKEENSNFEFCIPLD